MLRYLSLLPALLPLAAMAQPVPTSLTPHATGKPHICTGNYPEDALKAGAEGTTLLGFTVTAQGTVSGVTIRKTSGNAALDAASMTCASTWTYQPVTKDGAAVDVPWQAQVEWKMHFPLIPAAPFEPCTHFATATPDMLKGIQGRNWIGFLLMPDGSTASPHVLLSSGNSKLDQGAVDCVAKRRYDVSRFKVPAEGAPEYAEVDWYRELGLIAPPPPANAITVTAVTPPPAPAATHPLIATPVSVGKPHTCLQAYPLEALEQRAEGATTLSFRIAIDGSVKNPSVAKTSGNAALDAAAVTCASLWHYKPGTLDGVPVEVPWQAQVRWSMGDPIVAIAPATSCRQFVASTHKAPDNISGRSTVVFLLQADGSAVPRKVIESSGDEALDQAALRCVAARRFSVGNRTPPPGGFPEYTVVDWSQELAPAK